MINPRPGEREEEGKRAAMCPGSVDAAPVAGKSVCVMDAAGPLGHALVDRLLRRGYTVHAATYGRGEDEDGAEDPAAAALLKHLSRGGDAYGHRLKVFRADPFDYHAIADAVRGCAGVFCMFNTPDDQAQCDVSSKTNRTSLPLSVPVFSFFSISFPIISIQHSHHRIGF